MNDPCTKKEYQEKYSFEYRQDKTMRIQNKYSDRVPVFIENNSTQLPRLTNPKFLVPTDLNVRCLLYILKDRLNIQQTTPVYLYIDGRCCDDMENVHYLYKKFADPDGHLYLNYKHKPNNWIEQWWYKLMN